ncbi:MAG: hypothetical protein HY318_03580 [Armatimonadetes bacterium]|nr:hypothetical protein [Armatimonadota bacterium]
MHPTARKLREKIERRCPVLGTFLVEFSTPAVLHCLFDAGFDFVLVDTEHGQFSPREVELVVDVGWSLEMPVIVRVPDTNRGPITRALDAGAAGVLIPAISTLEQVQAVVRASKYTPVGRRGVHLFRGHTRHQAVRPPQFLEEANRDVLTLIQIELREALTLCDEIAALEGVDGLYVGPGDLGVDLGVPGQWGAPALWDAIAQTAASCRAHGKIMGCHYDFPEHLPKLGMLGVQMFGHYCDIGLFKKAAVAVRETFDANITIDPGRTKG